MCQRIVNEYSCLIKSKRRKESKRFKEGIYDIRDKWGEPIVLGAEIRGYKGSWALAPLTKVMDIKDISQ